MPDTLRFVTWSVVLVVLPWIVIGVTLIALAWAIWRMK